MLYICGATRTIGPIILDGGQCKRSSRLNVLERKLEIGLDWDIAYHDERVDPHPIAQICPHTPSLGTTIVSIFPVLGQARLGSF